MHLIGSVNHKDFNDIKQTLCDGRPLNMSLSLVSSNCCFYDL